MNLSLQDNTTPLDALPPVLQEELSQLLEEYLADLEKGVRRDPAELVAANPELAEPLKLYLESLDFLHKAAVDLGAESTTSQADDFLQRELGDFRIKREIGRGGMGIVYEAEQVSIRRKVALKVLPFAAVLDQKQIARFHNEAQAAGQLQHPHIVPVYSVGCERGVHYYSMQFIEGQPLDRAIEDLRIWAGKLADAHISDFRATASSVAGFDSSSPQRYDHGGLEDTALPTRRSPSARAEATTGQGFSTARSINSRKHVRTAAELAIQAADAIHHAHDYGIVHRDIKPSNLLVDRQGKLWITDFGLARCQEGTNITMTGDVLGTARYMSPEQAAGRGNLVDHRTDIFSFGVTLYELLTLRHPFAGLDRQTLLRQIEREEPVPPRRLNAAIPIDLETIVLKAVSKSRDDRYESAQAMADDLRRFLDGKPTHATRPTFLDRTARWAGRHLTVVASVVGVLLLALIGTAAAALLVAREKARTEQALVAANDNLQQSQTNLHKAIDVVDRFGMRLSHQLADVPGMEGLRRALLEETLRDYEGFATQLQHDPEMRFAQALSHSKIAGIHERLGQFGEALTANRKAQGIYTQLVREQPQVDRFQNDLALCHNNVGHVLLLQGHIAEANTAYREALAIERRLVAQYPSVPSCQSTLALTLTNLGRLQRETGEIRAAMATYQEVVGVQRELAARDPATPAFQSQLASSYNELSFLYGANDLVQAEQYNSAALAIFQQLSDADPNQWKHRADLATCYNNRGSIFKRNRRVADAQQAYERAIEIQEQLVRQMPVVVQFQNELGVSCNNLGQSLANESPEAAERHFERARELFDKLVATSPGSPKYRASLGGVLNNLGQLRENGARIEEAVAAYEQAAEHQIMAYEQAPQIRQFKMMLSTTYANYGRALRMQNRWEAAADVAFKRKELCRGSGESLYHVAADLALVAEQGLQGEPASSSEAAANWAAAAETTLEEAVDAGFRNYQALHDDQRFQGLKDRPRFKTLLAKLDTARPS